MKTEKKEQVLNSRDRNGALIKVARSIIYNNISNEKFSLSDLSRELYLSERQLQRIFKRSGSRGFRYELHLARIRAGKHYLKNSRQPVSAISKRVGFKGPMHFAKAFRRETGLSPVEWRRQNQKISA